MGVTVLSLFDGMSCAQIAFREMGIEVDTYHAYEVDKYPIMATQHNFPDTVQCGDVFKADFTKHRGVSWLCGGSPCTYWSIAQTKNRETEASGMGWELFSQYVRALHEAQPQYFLYENNYSMSAAIRDSISQAFGFEPVMINAALVSAQQRKRLYWLGKRQEDGSYKRIHVEQPQDTGVLLQDILESAWSYKDKAAALTATYRKGDYLEHELRKHIRTQVAIPINVTADGKTHTIKSQYSKTAAANLLATRSTRAASGAAETVPVAMRYERTEEGKRLRSAYEAHEVKHGYKEHKQLTPREDGKTNTITTKTQDNIIADVPGRRVYVVQDGQTEINGKQYKINLPNGAYTFRKLTVAECARCQTVPSWYDFSVVSNSRAYAMIGNGWCINVIKHLLAAAYEDAEDEQTILEGF